MSNIRLVVFDMAGTTINDGKTVYKAIQTALSKSGYEFQLQEVMDNIGGMNKLNGLEKLVNKKKKNPSIEEIHEIHDEFLRLVNQSYKTDPNLKEIEGTSEIFEYLKNHSIKIALDTGYHRKTANILIERMGWQKNNYIDFSVTSDEVPKGRPEPYMIHRIMKETDVNDPASILKIGDTVSDIREGKNANCGITVAIYSGTQSIEVLQSENPDYLIQDLSELKSIVKKHSN